MKHLRQTILVVTIVLMSSLNTQVSNAVTGQQNAQTPADEGDHSGDTSSFAACQSQGYKLVSENDKATQQALSAQGCHWAAKPFVAVGSSVLNSGSLVKIQLMLTNVAKQYSKDVDANIQYYRGLQKAFAQSEDKPVCTGGGKVNCPNSDLQTVTGVYGNLVAGLRRASALAHASGTDVKDLGNVDVPGLPKFLADLPVVAQGSLDSSEAATVKSDWAKLHPGKDIGSESAKTTARTDFANLMQDSVVNKGLMLVQHLPAPTHFDTDGTPVWNGKDWEDAIQEVINSASQEKTTTDALVKQCDGGKPCNLTFPALDVGFHGSERDLGYYTALLPVMNEYLQKYPKECGIAEAAIEWVHLTSAERSVTQTAAFFAAGAGLGLLTKAGKVGQGLSVLVMGAGGEVGLAMLTGNYLQTAQAAEDAKRRGDTIRAEPGREIALAPTGELQTATDAARDFWWNTVKFQAPLMLVAGGAGAVVGNKVGPAAARLEEALGKLISGTDGDAVQGLKELYMNLKHPETDVQKVIDSAPDSIKAQVKARVAKAEGSPEAMQEMILWHTLQGVRERLASSGQITEAELAQIDAKVDEYFHTAVEARVKAGQKVEVAAKDEAKIVAEEEGGAADQCGVKARTVGKYNTDLSDFYSYIF